jgi:ABC-type uncharacterized transport system permease subunit
MVASCWLFLYDLTRYFSCFRFGCKVWKVLLLEMPLTFHDMPLIKTLIQQTQISIKLITSVSFVRDVIFNLIFFFSSFQAGLRRWNTKLLGKLTVSHRFLGYEGPLSSS